MSEYPKNESQQNCCKCKIKKGEPLWHIGVVCKDCFNEILETMSLSEIAELQDGILKS